MYAKLVKVTKISKKDIVALINFEALNMFFLQKFFLKSSFIIYMRLCVDLAPAAPVQKTTIEFSGETKTLNRSFEPYICKLLI